MATKLQRLLEKEAQLKAQIQQAKAAERTLEKKRDTRRKILIGAAVMARVKSGEWPRDDLRMMMDGFLTRPNERALFDLDGADESGGQKAVQNSGEKPQAKKEKASEKVKAKKLPEPDDDLANEFNL